MDWIKKYDLFLFDFDGLLVNTEEMHYMAYQNMMKARGVPLKWSFERYCQAAHYEATALRDQIYDEYPELKEIEPDWSILYPEKSKAMLDLVENGNAHLMPGVKEILAELERLDKKRVVVTHSSEKLISQVRSQNPELDSIPNWITRENYTHPKPHPECYQKAIEMFSQPGDKIIGFEDTPRGLTALISNPVTAVLIAKVPYPEIEDFKKKGALHFQSFKELSK